MPDSRGPLVLVSNRGPVTFEDDGSVKRGTGGLVTALTGLASHRDAVWIASAMTDGDARKAARGRAAGVQRALAGGRRVPGAPGRLRPRRLRPLLQHLRQPDAVVHPALPLGPLQRAGHPPPRGRGVRVRLQRRQRGPRRGRDRGDRGRRGAGRDGPRLPPLHAAGARAARAPRRVPAPLRAHPVDADATPGACCPSRSARRSTAACWPTTSSASTPAPTGATSCSAAATSWTWRSTSRPASCGSRAARCGCAPTRCRSTPRRCSPWPRSDGVARLRSASCCAAGATT